MSAYAEKRIILAELCNLTITANIDACCTFALKSKFVFVTSKILFDIAKITKSLYRQAYYLFKYTIFLLKNMSC